MAVTRYYTANGRIRGQATGGARTNILPDALGSVTATVDESGTVENTYRYKPYGQRLSKTGAGADPKFLWSGTHGYRQANGSLSYVRARHYSSKLDAWNSVASLWPRVTAYSYAMDNPVSLSDLSGNERTLMSPRVVKSKAGLCPPDDKDWECKLAYECYKRPFRCDLSTDHCCKADSNFDHLCKITKCCMDFDGDGECHMVEFWQFYFVCRYGRRIPHCCYPYFEIELPKCVYDGTVHFIFNEDGSHKKC